MNALRWILSSFTALVMVGFILLVVLADNFRRSFGASENGPIVTLLPVTLMLVFLASLLFPGQRILLHLAAIAALALAGWAVWIFRESVFMGVTGLLYSAVFLVWYWYAAWARASSSTL